MAVPAPAYEQPPEFTARALLARIRRRGGRVYRMREIAVFVLTDSEELAQWLISLGGKPYRTRNLSTIDGSYVRAPGGRPEWDIYIHIIPVRGERSIWDAAARDEQVHDPREYA